MSHLALPTGKAARVPPRSTMLAGTAALTVLAFGIAIAVRFDLLLEVLGLAVALLAVLLSLRWPLLPLFAFAALLPVEDLGTFAGIGTVSRFAGLLFALTYALPRLGQMTLRAIPLAGWAFIAWATMSLAWALDQEVAWSALATLIQLFAIAVFIADVVVRRPEVVRQLLWTYTISAAVTALIALGSFVSSGALSSERLAAFQGSGQDVAQFAAILLPAMAFALFELINGRVVLLSGPVVVVTILAIVLSGTRGAWLATVVVIVLFVFHLQPHRRVTAIAALGLALVVAAQLPGVAGMVAERSDSAISSGGAGRTEIWKVAIEIVDSAPIAGVGYGNFALANTSSLNREARVPLETQAIGPHSILFGTAGELGAIGVGTLALFLLPLMLRAGSGPYGFVIQASLVSLMTSALFLDVLNRKQVWLIIGVAAGLVYLATRRPHDVVNAAPGGQGISAVRPAPRRAGPEPKATPRPIR